MADDDTQQPRFDRWSLVHAAAGALITLGFWATGIKWFSLLVTVALELAWEVYENSKWEYGGTWLWTGGPCKPCKTCGDKYFGMCIYPDYSGDEARHTIWDIYITTSGGLLAAIFLSTIGLNATSLGLILGFSGFLLAIFAYLNFSQSQSREGKLVSLLPIQTPVYKVDGILF